MNSRLLLTILFAGIIVVSCKKSSDPIENKGNDLIGEARAYFNENVLNKVKFSTGTGLTPNKRQSIDKSPLWDQAYTSKAPVYGDIVVVPLKFNKDLTLKSKETGGPDLSINDQAHLFIYKNTSGFHVELVTAFPDKSFSKTGSSAFSGYVLVEDWAGNNIKKYLFRDGKAYKLVQQTESNKSGDTGNRGQATYCYARDWYLCSVDQNGQPFDCVYEYTEVFGCYEEIKYDELNNEETGGGGNIYMEEVSWIGNAVLERTVYEFSTANGGGICKLTQRLTAKIHNNHPNRDFIRSCAFIRSDVVNNTMGVTSTVGQYDITGLGTKAAVVAVGGTLKYPNKSWISYTTTMEFYFDSIAWGN